MLRVSVFAFVSMCVVLESTISELCMDGRDSKT